MSFAEAFSRLASIPGLQVSENQPLAEHTRFGIGGPARVFADTESEPAFIEALRAARASGLPWMVIGLGTNLVVHDAGCESIVLRYRGGRIGIEGNRVTVEAGAVLQDLVDFAVDHGLAGLDRMTGIPGQAGAAIYGNAGAYGSSTSDFVRSVRFFDGDTVRELDRDGCEFRYRSSIFKQNKHWLILSATLEFAPGDAAALRAKANEIRAIRDAKYPPTMQCAGSIFKNLILAELPQRAQAQVPPEIVKGGKAPSAWFLEVSGVKGMRSGGIHVADYHANLIYNAGGGTARQLVEVIDELKRRVRERFGIVLEEEVQFVGFENELPGRRTLEKTMQILDAFLDGTTDEELEWKPAPERWSIGEVLVHLAHVEEFAITPRLRILVEQDGGEFENYDQTQFDALGIYRSQPARRALEWLREMRRENLEYLNAAPRSALGRTARHSTLGVVTLEQQLNEWALHDLGHVRQIAELLRAVRYYPRIGPWQHEYSLKP